MPPDFAALVHRINPAWTLRQTAALTGGVSAQATVLTVDLPDGATRKLTVRQHGPNDRARNPNIAADEFRLLQTLHAHGLPVPAPIGVQPPGDGFDFPAIVLGFIDGATDFNPAGLVTYLEQAAATLAQIHQIPADHPALAFLPVQANCLHWFAWRINAIDDSLDEARIRAAVVKHSPPATHNPRVLLHGDFWPGNLIWRHGQLAGVIDWEDAARGDPLTDLAIARLDLASAFDFDAMDTFTRAYRRHNPTLDSSMQPYWDLCAALRPAGQIDDWAAGWPANGRPDVTATRLRARHRQFVAQALAAL